MSAAKGLQYDFLNELQSTQMTVSIFLVNGVKLHGHIEKFDEEVIVLKSTLSQIVYKHSISTVVPSQPVNI